MPRVLEPEWSFWLVLVTPTSGGAQYSIEEIISVATVESFWEYFQALPRPHELKNPNRKRISIALFRHDIQPAWEHVANEHGGAYSIMLPRDVVDGVWEDLLLSAIGGTLPDHLMTTGNQINGLVVSPKHEQYAIDIWTKDEEKWEGEPKIGGFLAELPSANGQIISPVTFKQFFPK
jgi:hypothetical protein